MEQARVTAGDRVLVLGASGGVGSTIVSLCRSLGARV
jgi:NADPH:quinone reductase-like Zn-dependent oxidoreductase